MVYSVGVNDMPRGWQKENERIYRVWQGMLCRCYSKKFQEKGQTYKNCYVCERWLLLSNFVEDITKIDGYELWLNNPNKRISLDKDIKSNGKNKCYCLEECQFVTVEENCRQANKTREYTKHSKETRKKMSESRKGNKNAKGKHLGSLIDRYDKQGNYIDTKYQFEYVNMGFTGTHISACCKGKLKSVGRGKGTEKFIFKYHKEVVDSAV